MKLSISFILKALLSETKTYPFQKADSSFPAFLQESEPFYEAAPSERGKHLNELHKFKKIKLYQIFSKEKKYRLVADFLQKDLWNDGSHFLDFFETPRTLSIDSRFLKKQDVFLALKGERFDAHHFLKDVFEKGQSFCIGSEAPSKLFADEAYEESLENLVVSDLQFYLEVDHTLLALGKVALAFSEEKKVYKIAVTGSVGKTSVREMLAQAFSAFFATHSTKENLNNEVGVAKTLLAIPEESQVAVLELGMDRPGDLAYLAPLVAPKVAVITNIGYSHIAYFENLEHLAENKAEILTGLQEDGVALFSAKDAQLLRIADKVAPHYLQKKHLLLAALVDEAQELEQARELLWQEKVTALYYGLWLEDEEAIDFYEERKLENQIQKIFLKKIRLSLQGKHHYENACFAFALLSFLQKQQILNTKDAEKEEAFCLLADIEKALQKVESVGKRQAWSWTNSVGVMDDAYNASLSSFQSAFDAFTRVAKKKKTQSLQVRKIAVVGGVLELGSYTKEVHQKIAEALYKSSFEKIYLLGQETKETEARLLSLGYPSQNLFHSLEKEKIKESLFETVQEGDMVLFKASHGYALFEMADQLLQKLTNR